MATLLSTQTTDTTGTGAAHTGPCSVHVRGTLAGAKVAIEASDEDETASYSPAGLKSEVLANGWRSFDIQGDYFLRAKLIGATAATSVTVVTTQ